MANKVQGVRGMNDVLPDDARYWAFFESTVQRWLHAYGYREIRMPILERTELFVRSGGDRTQSAVPGPAAVVVPRSDVPS